MKTIIVGDVHGEYLKLHHLMLRAIDPLIKTEFIFVGDFVDRGPDSKGVLDLVDLAIEGGWGKAVLGNHDKKLLKRFKRFLNDETPPTHSAEVESTLYQFTEFAEINELNAKEVVAHYLGILEKLPYFLELEDGTKIVHAYYDARAIDKPQKKQELMLYGPVDRTLAPREDGLPNRIPWWDNYDGRNGRVIFGHYSPADTVQVYSEHAICVDTGVYKTNVLGAYVLETGETIYV